MLSIIFIGIGIILLGGILFTITAKLKQNTYDDVWLEVLQFLIVLIFGITTLLYFTAVPISYYSAKKTAAFLNKSYNTNYSIDDVFWNADIIKENIIGEKKNINVKVE